MTDMLKTGVEWFTSQLKTKVGQTITYRRGQHSVVLTGTFGESNHDVVTPDGLPIEVHSRDFLVDVADLKLNDVATTPKRGDTIEYTDANGTVYTHEVMQLGNEPGWRYSDPYRVKYRIHTERVKVPT